MEEKEVGEWLTKMGLKYKLDSKKMTFSVIYEEGGKNWDIRVFVGKHWIQIAARVAMASELPADKREEILEHVLKANYELNEVTFSMDKDGNLYSENDVPKVSNFENFRSEFTAVPFGIRHWMKNIQPLLGG
ncbi:MAG: hypothetical protein ACXACI_17490 [Candidatus Hodarchaeales archaeon]|jgi:hypothetical protein